MTALIKRQLARLNLYRFRNQRPETPDASYFEFWLNSVVKHYYCSRATGDIILASAIQSL